MCLGWRPPLSVSQRFRALITERSLPISCGRTGRGRFLQGICHHSFGPPIFSAYSAVKKQRSSCTEEGPLSDRELDSGSWRCGRWQEYRNGDGLKRRRSPRFWRFGSELQVRHCGGSSPYQASGIDKLERDSQVLQASSEALCSTLFTRSLGKAFGEENKKHRGCKYDKTGLLHVFRWLLPKACRRLRHVSGEQWWQLRDYVHGRQQRGIQQLCANKTHWWSPPLSSDNSSHYSQCVCFT